MSIIGWIILGFVGGVMAKLIVTSRDSEGMIGTILMGIGGALVGELLSLVLEWTGEGDPSDVLMAAISLIAVVFAYRHVRDRAGRERRNLAGRGPHSGTSSRRSRSSGRWAYGGLARSVIRASPNSGTVRRASRRKAG